MAEDERGDARVGFLIPGSVLLKFLAEVGDKIGEAKFADQFRAQAPLFGSPDLPRKLLSRKPLVQSIVDMVLCESKAPVGLLGLRGMAGVEKTVVARLLIEDDGVRRRFHDGVYWLTVGENKSPTDVEALQQKLLTQLNGKSHAESTLDGLRTQSIKNSKAEAFFS
jgi:NB-ARC domain